MVISIAITTTTIIIIAIMIILAIAIFIITITSTLAAVSSPNFYLEIQFFSARPPSATRACTFSSAACVLSLSSSLPSWFPRRRARHCRRSRRTSEVPLWQDPHRGAGRRVERVGEIQGLRMERRLLIIKFKD